MPAALMHGRPYPSHLTRCSSGATRASVGSDQYGPFVTIYVGDGEERTTFRFLHPSYDAPCVVATTSGGSSTVWHG